MTELNPRVRLVVTDPVRTSYEFAFGATDGNQIAVHVQGMEEVPAFTISVNADGIGGSVLFESGLTIGSILTIYRSMDVERVSEFNEGAPLQAASLNVELNNSILLLQQAAMQAGDAIRKPVYDDSPDLILPDVQSRAGTILGFDGDGQIRAYEDIAVSSLGAENAAVAAQQARNASETARDEAVEAATTVADLVYWRVEYFNGNGAEQSLPLAVDPGSANLVFVTVDGVERFQSDWLLIDGAVVGTFPPGVSNVQIRYGVATPVGDIPALSVSTGKIANGAVTQDKIDPSVELGGPSVGPIRINPTVITEDLILQDKHGNPCNGMIAGPVTVADGVTLTVPDGSTLTVV